MSLPRCSRCHNQRVIRGAQGWVSCPQCCRPSEVEQEASRYLNSIGARNGRRLTIRELIDRGNT